MNDLCSTLKRADVLPKLSRLDLLVTYPVETPPLEPWEQCFSDTTRLGREEKQLKEVIGIRRQGALKYLGLRSVPASADGIPRPSPEFRSWIGANVYDFTAYKY